MFNTTDSANIYLSENFIQSNLNGSIEISINELYALGVVIFDSFYRFSKELRPLLC